MGEAGRRVRQAWLGGMAGGGRDPRPTVNARTSERRLKPTIRIRRQFAPELGRVMARLPMIAEWNAPLPPVARQGQSCPLTVYADVVGQGPFAWQGSNAPWRNPARPSDNRAASPHFSRYSSGDKLYCVRRCRFNDLNFRPSSRHTRNSRVTDFLADTAGFGVSAAAAIVPEVTRSNAECTSLINDGRSLAGTELLLTYAETMSAASSMKLLELEVSLMALDIPEE